MTPFKLIRIAPLCCTLLACAAQVDMTEPEDSPSAENVAVAASALSSPGLPGFLQLHDAKIDGIEERVFMGNGFVFRNGVETKRGTAALENHGNAAITVSYQALTVCIDQSGNDYTAYDKHVGVVIGKNGQASASAPCSSPYVAKESAASFWDMTTTATDLGYAGTGYASNLELQINSASTVSFGLGDGLVFTSKLRSTWGASEFANQGSTWVTVRNLYASIGCAGGTPVVKAWGPQVVAPGQTMTSTVGCPSGQTVTSTYSKFTRP